MKELANRLMFIEETTTTSNTPTAIFGSISTLPQHVQTRPPIRIGIWPIVSDTDSTTAMGIAAALGYLLERWRDIQVYRLFVKLGEDADVNSFSWTMSASQFDIDDWSIDELDENVAIWGTLKRSDSRYLLELQLENDFDESDEPLSMEYSAADVSELMRLLPQISSDIATKLDAQQLDESAAAFKPEEVSASTSAYEQLLARLFSWERSLFLAFWGQDWPDEDIQKMHSQMATEALNTQDAAGAWYLGAATARIMLPGSSVYGDAVSDDLENVLARFTSSTYIAPMFAESLYRMGFAERAFNILEDATDEHTDDTVSWLKLCELYARSGRLIDAIDTAQAAIESGVKSAALFRLYGSLLASADQQDISIEEMVLSDGDAGKGNAVAWEAAKAYEFATDIAPDDVISVHRLALQLIYLDTDAFWKVFTRLLVLDSTGHRIRDVIDAMYNMDDLEPAISKLENSIKEYPERIDLYTSLAALHLMDEDPDSARLHLEVAYKKADDVSDKATIEQMLLSANDPEFEQRFGELMAMIDAGNSPSTDDIDFLEEAVEEAPLFVEANLLLAKAYRLWGDEAAALEVLLDAHKQFEDDAEVVDALAGLLWETDERELAFEYLNRGIVRNPSHVPLIVRTARYLFDSGDLASARAYMARAEGISPRDRTLTAARAYIAQRIANDPSLVRDEKTDYSN